jgi:hypothetical protein
MTYVVARPDAEIDEVLNLAADQEDKGGTAYPGMSFEQGVSQGIRWVTGLGDAEPPLP